MQNVRAIEFPSIHDAFEISQRPVGLGFGKPYFDARCAAGELVIESVAFFFEAEALEQFLRVAAPSVEAGKQTQCLHDAELVRKRRGLQRRADLVLKGL